MSWLVFFANLLSPKFASLAKSTGAIQVVTIGFSHYCELAMWSLKYKGMKVAEYDCAPAMHLFPALALRVGGKEKHLSTSSRTTEVEKSAMSDAEAAAKRAKEEKKDRAARATAVPVAVCPQGRVWKDSWEIVELSGLAPCDPHLKTLLDEKVGPLARQYAYHFILQPRNTNIWNRLFTEKRPWWWTLLWKFFLGSYMRTLMSKMMKPGDIAAVAQCRKDLVAAIGEVDQILLNKKTKYLGGDSELSAGDIAIASLTSPLVNPPLYCGGKFAFIFEDLMRQDAELMKEVDYMRSTVTGKYVLELYEKHR